MHRLVKLLLTLGLSLGLGLPAMANQSVNFGDIEVYYSAINSTYLEPKIAAANDLERSKNLGVMNVVVLKNNKAAVAYVDGVVTDMVGREQLLAFREVREGDAIYYLGQFAISQAEQLHFKINFRVSGGTNHSFEFNQEVFPVNDPSFN